MRTVKRYSNRKLYDTTARKYVTLDDIAKLVKDGEDVKVIDNVTGDDLTNITLSQILHEKERKHKDSLPKNFFTQVIQSGTKLKDAVVEKGGKLFGGGLESALRGLRIPTRTEFEQLQKAMAKLEKGMRAVEKRLGIKSDNNAKKKRRKAKKK